MIKDNTMNKKATLACLTIASAVCITAQAQNHFPSSGNVGIGITTPIYLLDIRSTSSNNLHVSGTGNDDGAYFGTNFNGGFWMSNAMRSEEHTSELQSLRHLV